MPEFFKQGALVRTTPDLADADDLDGHRWFKGFTFEVEEFVAGGDVAKNEIAANFYNGSANGGFNNVTVPADAVELVMSAEAMAARTLPDAKAVGDFLQNALLSDGAGFTISETERDGNVVEIYGRTDHGLNFGLTVGFSELRRTDD